MGYRHYAQRATPLQRVGRLIAEPEVVRGPRDLDALGAGRIARLALPIIHNRGCPSTDNIWLSKVRSSD